MICRTFIFAVVFLFAVVLGQSAKSNSTKPAAVTTKAKPISTTNVTEAAQNRTAQKPSVKIGSCDKSIKHIAQIHNVEIKDCKGNSCTFKRGEKYYIRVEFTPIQRITSLDLNITGIIAKKPVPFGVNSDKLCSESIAEMKDQTKCGLKRGQLYHFEYSMEVLKLYPAISLHVSFQLKYNDKSVFCFMFPVKLI